MRSHLVILNMRARGAFFSRGQAFDMHIYLALAALAQVQSALFVIGAPLTAIPLSSNVTAETQFQGSPDQGLALAPAPLSEGSAAPRQSLNIWVPSNQSNTTLKPPQGFIPYRMKGSSTSLLFHGFGDPIPSRYLLQCLSYSLTLILEMTLDGRGKDLIANGYFSHKHIMPNGDFVEITAADFREIGRPMDYDALRDTLSGIGDFVTEPGRGITTLSYEVEVDGKGYVGTGHVGFELAGSGQ